MRRCLSRRSVAIASPRSGEMGRHLPEPYGAARYSVALGTASELRRGGSAQDAAELAKTRAVESEFPWGHQHNKQVRGSILRPVVRSGGRVERPVRIQCDVRRHCLGGREAGTRESTGGASHRAFMGQGRDNGRTAREGAAALRSSAKLPN